MPSGCNYLHRVRSKYLPERGQSSWTLRRNRHWPNRKQKKDTSCRETRVNKRLKARSAGWEVKNCPFTS